MKLIISEAFYSLQGEGATAGYPALFIRFPKCNLHCSWCDSQEVMSKTQEIDLLEMMKGKVFNRVIFTGGEPILYEKKIMEIISFIKNEFVSTTWFFEVETNGTLLPSIDLRNTRYIQFNISPKLSNSGMSQKIRKAADNVRYMLKNTNSIVKFVVQNQSDITEIYSEFGDIIKLYKSSIYLMPAGSSKKELEVTAPLVAQMCIDFGFKFSNRQHIILWDTKKGV